MIEKLAELEKTHQELSQRLTDPAIFSDPKAYRELNKVAPDCGTSFTWTTKAFGPYVGWLGGWAAVLATVIVLSNLTGVAVQFFLAGLGVFRAQHGAEHGSVGDAQFAHFFHPHVVLGDSLLIVGILHGLNVLALPVIGRILTLNRRLDEGADTGTSGPRES